MPRFPNTTPAICSAHAALHRRITHAATRRFVAHARRALLHDGSATRTGARRLVARLAKLARRQSRSVAVGCGRDEIKQPQAAAVDIDESYLAPSGTLMTLVRTSTVCFPVSLWTSVNSDT